MNLAASWADCCDTPNSVWECRLTTRSRSPSCHGCCLAEASEWFKSRLAVYHHRIPLGERERKRASTLYTRKMIRLIKPPKRRTDVAFRQEQQKTHRRQSSQRSYGWQDSSAVPPMGCPFSPGPA
jgi:hypothetical protein